MALNRPRPWHYVLAALALGLVVLVLAWNWDWFIPIVQRVASVRLGRPVTIAHLHVRIARNPVLEADDVVVDNPPGFAAPGPFARIGRLAVTLNGPAYLHGQAIIVPALDVDRPVVQAIALADGRNNWSFAASGPPASGPPAGGPLAGGRPASSPRIGDLRITDGQVHAVVPRLKADFTLGIATRAADAGRPAQLLADVGGTYAGQPITGRFIGGALLTLRDTTDPYPVDLRLANGATHVALIGTVEDPLAFAGTRLKLQFEGANLADLYPLTGIAVPATPPYRLTGDLSYADRRIRFEHFAGRLGSSDIGGSITVDPGAERPRVDANLVSRQVDLTDLGGFIGGTPGRAATPGETQAQRAEVARAEASPRLIPNTPFNLPRLRAADVALHYKGEHIEGRSVPLDNLVVEMTIKDGTVELHPVSFGVGVGRIVGTITLTPLREREVRAHAEIDFQRVDVARLLSATHTFGGAGTIGGHAEIEGSGDSVAGILGDGNGELKLFMTGGDLSALLVDLSGLQFGNALLSALGAPQRTQVRCLVTDFALRHGIMDTRTMLLDTGEANVSGKGDINLREETINYQLRTQARHFSIGSLPAPIDITGHLKHPSVMPDAKDLAVRGGLAAGLGVLLTPLAALLPTIQLGLGENNNCGELIREARRSPNPAEPPRAER
jgi:uncharacterized protein involved in outer membrane biogenesis